MRKKKYRMLLVLSMLIVLVLIGCLIKAFYSTRREDEEYKTIAYVTVPASENWRWIGIDEQEGDEVISDVDVRYVTHIHFAFGMLEAYQFENETLGEPLKQGKVVSSEAYKNPIDGQYHYKVTLKGWIEEMQTSVDGEKYLQALVDLKDKKPSLKVLLSIGGWDSDGFCYMAKTPEGRAEFAQSCVDIIREYGLDGIDLDWEYPPNGGWGEIASCKTCIQDASLLLKELRQTFDAAFPNDHKLLAIASGASTPWVDEETFKALDYINVMCYDYSPGSGESQADFEWGKTAMVEHVKKVGDSKENRAKINLGVPFYNEGGPYLVPYYKEWIGYVDASPEITANKMDWVKEEGFGGGFYWAYSMDIFEEDREDLQDPNIKILQRTLYETLNGQVVP